MLPSLFNSFDFRKLKWFAAASDFIDIRFDVVMILHTFSRFSAIGYGYLGQFTKQDTGESIDSNMFQQKSGVSFLV
jgi:hypothetical protein